MTARNSHLVRALPTFVCATFSVLALLMVEMSGDNALGPPWAIRSWAICLFVTAWFTFYSLRRQSYWFLVSHLAAAALLCLRAFTTVGAPESLRAPLSQAIDATAEALGLGLFGVVPPCSAFIAGLIWNAQRKETPARQSAPLEHAP